MSLLLFPLVAAGAAHAMAAPPIDRFEGEVLAYEAADRVAPPARCQTLFVGSSSIRLWDPADRHFAFPALWRGVGGSTVAEMDHYFPRLVAPYRPARIVFYAGENDLEDGRTPREVLADLQAFVAMKRAALGGVPMFVLGAKPSPARLASLPAQRAFNALAKAYAETQGDLRYVDISAPMMAGAAVRPDIFREDRLHMTGAGYALWTRALDAAFALPAKGVARDCQRIGTTGLKGDTPLSPKASTATK